MHIKKEKIIKIITQEGWSSLIKKSFKYIVSKIFDITNLIIFELDLEHSTQKVSNNTKLKFREALKEDIESMDEDIYGYDQTGKEYFINQLSKGDKCIVASYGESIVGYIWIMKDYMELSKFKHVPIPKNKVYTYKAFVLKNYRRNGIRSAIDIYINKNFKKQGKKYIISTVAKSNMPSIKVKERTGFKKIGKIVQFRFFGLKYDYIKKEDLSYIQSS